MKVFLILPAFLVALIIESCIPSPSAPGTPPDLNPIETPRFASETPLYAPSTGSAIPEYETETNPSLPIPARTDPQMLIENTREDLAERLSISDTLINLVEIDEVLWPDVSLGCPQAGDTYAQTQTLGYLVKLEYAGNEFEYHANIHGVFFYCENPTPPISSKLIEINH